VRGRGLLFSSFGEPRLVVPGIIGVIIAFVVALSAITFANRPKTREERAESLLRNAKPAQAERVYVELIREKPTIPLVLRLIEIHDQARRLAKVLKLREQMPKGRDSGRFGGLPDLEPPLPDDEIEKVLSELPEDIGVVARFAQNIATQSIPEEVRKKIDDGAEKDPPMPWANHLLAREAQHERKHAEAAGFLEKEALAFPTERKEDLNAALQIWTLLGAWDTLREKLADHRIKALADPHFAYRLAVHDRDWKGALRFLPNVWTPKISATGLVMSGIAALGWMFFCARLGRLRRRLGFRLPMYALAFAFGVASVVPTVTLITIEEAKLNLVETGDAARDALFFVFGVGLREELSKILLFLPLLPLLRKWGDKLDVLVCGALVGLGFAAEENLGYLAQENLSTGLGRFLTANFFHMAATGTLASAVDDFISDREKHAQAFTRTSLLVVGIHGAYDFLLSHPEYGGAYFAMACFVFLTRMFLNAVGDAQVREARKARAADAAKGAALRDWRRGDGGISPLHAFIFAVAIVTGVSLAYAVMAVGPTNAVLVMGSGLLGEAIIVYVFVRTLRSM
jgi:RsiW-degrading membrane proteinase PrsW (M82 family)